MHQPRRCSCIVDVFRVLVLLSCSHVIDHVQSFQQQPHPPRPGWRRRQQSPPQRQHARQSRTTRYASNRQVLLSDVPTPAFIFDIDALQKRMPSPNAFPRGSKDKNGVSNAGDKQQPQPQAQQSHQPEAPYVIPCVSINHVETTNNQRHSEALRLVPVAVPPSTTHETNASPCYRFGEAEDACTVMTPSDMDELLSTPGVCYFHSRVVQSRILYNEKKKEETEENDDSTRYKNNRYLAQIDLGEIHFHNNNKSHTDDGNNGHESTTSINAQLVLGLNNHHVISYYWARSAGTGASMDAPGIVYRHRDGGILEWMADDLARCQSNDGKRSEWVNFLRAGDQVQLIPVLTDPPPPIPTRGVAKSRSSDDGDCEIDHQNDNRCTGTAISFLLDQFIPPNYPTSRIYGISTKGRPLGGEPAVVCQWTSTSP